MIKQYNVTVNGTTYEVTVESAAGGRMASAPISRAAAAPVAAAPAPKPQGMQPEILAAITAALSEEIGIPSRSMNIVNIKKI